MENSHNRGFSHTDGLKGMTITNPITNSIVCIAVNCVHFMKVFRGSLTTLSLPPLSSSLHLSLHSPFSVGLGQYPKSGAFIYSVK